MHNKNTGRKAAALKVLALASTALVGIALPFSAQAQEWTGATSGSWFDGTNWNPAHVPTAADDATLDSNGAHTPNIGGSGNNGVANHVTVGDTNTGSGVQLNIENGGTLTSTSGVIGNLAGSNGGVDVGGFGGSGFISKWTNSGTLVIGNAGQGTLSIGAGEVSNTDGTIGALAGSNGYVGVSGPTAKWTNSGTLTVGGAGTGTLNVFNGGTVNNAGLGSVGDAAGSTGTVTVKGAGSTWTNAGDLFVGRAGIGTLNITNGGSVSSGLAEVGYNAGSNGSVTVSGAGSTWIASSALTVGEIGTGKLTIANGGAVANTGGYIGFSSASSGTVTVDGPNSTWTNSLILSVGVNGTASLAISNGGKVTNTDGFVGYNSGSDGAVTVAGVGSTWTNVGDLFVGRAGTGTLNITNGGSVSSGLAEVGYNAGSNGSVTVSGAGSTWIASSALTVGEIGTGKLTIANGGAVANTGGYIGFSSASSGTVTVDGPNSTWTNSLILSVGVNGTASLAISNGGKVTNTDGFVGYNSGSDGAVTVAGAGSTWTNTGDLEVGRGGTATLDIKNGGVVSNVQGNIGKVAGGTGTVTVDGPSSKWTNSGSLYVGNDGAGTLNITNGGTVNAGFTSFGSSVGATGTGNVDGPGSTLAASGNLTVGSFGTGTLYISNGGTVSNLVGTIGAAAGSSGIVFLQDAGSSWNVTNDLVVGDVGQGSLVISKGAKVSVGGTLFLAKNAGSAGDLNIGGGVAAGTLDATNVEFGAGAGRILFSHAGTNYNFDAAVSGLGTINQWKGVTHLTADSSLFTGATHITGGTLLVDGKIGTGAVDVQTGGTLGGKGLIGGAVTIASGGTLSGIQGQTLTMQDLSLASGANVNVTLSTPGGAALFNVVNDLTLDGTLNITSGGAFGPGVYGLMTYGGTLTDNGLDIGSTPSGSTMADFTVQTSVAGKVNLVSTALPNLAFWDGDGAGNANNNAVDGGSGVWSAISTNWTDANGTTNGVMHPQPGFAIFQGTAGTVTADASAGGIAVTGMQFASDGYQITGAPITLADPNSIIRVGDGTAGGQSYKATIGSVLTGAGGLNKTDLGTLILTADNTYTGGTTITDGTLQLGNGGTSGSIVGNVVNDGLLVFNRSDVTTFAGAISGGGAILQKGPGTTNLTGNSVSFTGAVMVDGGTLRVNGGGVLNGSGLYAGGSIGTTGAFVVDGAGSSLNGSDVLLVGIGGTGSLTVTNGGKVSNTDGALGLLAGSTGTATIAGAGSSWSNTGDLYVGWGGTGTLAISNGGVVSNKIGLIGEDAGSSGSVSVDGAGSKWTNSNAVVVGNAGTGALTISNGGVVTANAGVLVAGVAGSTGTVNIGGAAGSAPTTAGTLNALALQFGSGTGTLNFNHTDTNYAFATEIQGAGTINQLAGNTNLTGDSNGFSGAVNVTGGRLAVNGMLANGQVVVSNGGTLGGNGVVGNTTIQSGGIIAPGNSIGTLNINGNLSQAAGSIYQVELASTGQSDLIKASGTATIANGALLNVTKVDSGTPLLGTRYTVLEAAAGVSGTYTFNDIKLSNFISVIDTYDPTHVYLDVAKTKSFASAGLTPNQIATAGGADSLPLTNPLFNAIAWLPNDAAAQYAFDQLSGEIHSSAKTVMIEDSRFLRSAVNDRLRAAFGGVGASGGNTVTYDGGKPRAIAADTDGGAVWGQAFGSWGHWNSDGNAARLNRSIGGFFMGADAPAFDNWRFGAVAGYSRSSLNAKDRNSSGTSDNYSVGIYGGTTWGDLAFRTGAAYTVSDIATSRRVSFAGFGDSLSADYHAGTAQVFGELGYKMQAGNVALEPFANLAYVNLYTKGFSEKGGVAALSSGSSNSDATFTTLGLRASTSFDLNGMAVTAKGMVGWRHAFGDVTPNSVMSFAGSAPFSIGGVPIAKNAAVVDLGLDMNLSANTTLGVSYGGQFGSGVTDQTLRANFSVKF